MKLMALSLVFISFMSWGQTPDPSTYFNLFDNKVYSLKSKGVKDFVVDISSSKLTKQINEQKIFGEIKEVIFRTYWTANPERLSIEIVGLPQGFKEIKEDLKMSVMGLMDNLIPMTIPQRFAGYKFSATSNPKEFMAKDQSGISGIPSFLIKFDSQDRLIEIVGNKPIGSWNTVMTYDKKAFSDGKWVLSAVTTTTQENGQTLLTTRKLDYGTSQGMGVLTEVTINNEQKLEGTGNKSVSLSEEIIFSNYKINTGEALKHFLGESAP